MERLQGKRLFFTLLLLLSFNSTVRSQFVKVGLFNVYTFHEALITPLNEGYLLQKEDRPVGKLNKNFTIRLLQNGDSLMLWMNSRQIGNFKRLRLVSTTTDGSFQINLPERENKECKFSDNLIVWCDSAGIHLVNHLELEKYVQSVIEIEAGSGLPDEYYRVQAIMSRTYAIAGLKRHEKNGFSVCDNVHCQSFLGKAKGNERIAKAVTATKGFVAIDKELKAITAAYHTNCGGYTANSDDQWVTSQPYLKSVRDTFCFRSRNARWQFKLPVKDWQTYLVENGYSPEGGLEDYNKKLTFGELYYSHKNISIPLKKIRIDWKLRSINFSIQQNADLLTFTGYGYGHGVGLCQEGGIHMAELGYRCSDIIYFYYSDVQLMDVNVLRLLQEN